MKQGRQLSQGLMQRSMTPDTVQYLTPVGSTDRYVEQRIFRALFKSIMEHAFNPPDALSKHPRPAIAVKGR